MQDKITVEKKEHYLHRANEAIRQILPAFPSVVGENQRKYKSKRGVVSLVREPNNIWTSKVGWEIYCLEGDLFEDTEVYPTKAKAERRIRELLGGAKGVSNKGEENGIFLFIPRKSRARL